MGAMRIGRGWFQTGESGLPGRSARRMPRAEISSKVPSIREWSSRVQNLSGRKLGVGGENLLQPIRFERDVVVEDRDPVCVAGCDSAIDGGGEAQIFFEADHACAAFSEIRGVVGRAVVDQDHLIERPSLRAEAWKERFQEIAAIPVRDYGGDG